MEKEIGNLGIGNNYYIISDIYSMFVYFQSINIELSVLDHNSTTNYLISYNNEFLCELLKSRDYDNLLIVKSIMENGNKT